MVTVTGVAGLVLLVGINTVLAGIVTRFVRLVAVTRSGTAIGILVAVPLALTLSTMLLSGVFYLGVDLRDTTLAVILAIGIPMALGLTIDYVWVASPAEVEDALEG